MNTALAGGEVASDRVRTHFRQAVLGLLSGLLAWLLTATLAMSLLYANDERSTGRLAALLAFLFLTPVAVVVALFGLGQATAALRVRGRNMMLATLGLGLCGLHIGAIVGLYLFEVWQF